MCVFNLLYNPGGVRYFSESLCVKAVVPTKACGMGTALLSRAADPYAIRVGICLEVFTGLSLNFITIRI